MTHRVTSGTPLVFCSIALAFAFALIGLAPLTADEPDYLYGGPQGVYTPGYAVPVEYGTNVKNSAPLDITIYRVPLDSAAALSTKTSGSIVAADFSGFTVVTKFASTEHVKEQPESRTATIPPLPIGYYGVVAQAGSASAAALVDISTLGVVENDLGVTRSFFAVDLRTFNRHTGPTSIEIWAGTNKRRIECDTTGVALIRSAQPAENGMLENSIAVATTQDGSAQILRYSPYMAQSSEVGFVQSDRPIYRPGDTIDLRAIVRTGAIGSYVVPHGNRQVTVTAPDGTIVYRKEEPLSAFGTVHAEVILPQDAQLGNYGVQVGALSWNVIVAAYKKPEYAITFAADKPFTVGGDRASFALNAQYFFGRPAAGLHLHYVAYKLPQFIPWESPYPEAVARVSVMHSYEREKIAEGDFVTDAAGNSTVALGTQKVDAEQTIDVEAEGRDASGRTVSTRASVRVVPASFSIGLAPAQWFAQQGQPESIAVTTENYAEDSQTGDPTPRAGVPVSVEIVGTRWDEKTQKSVEISREAQNVTTDSHGKATLSWTPRASGSFVFTAKATDERGDIAQNSLYLWVVDVSERSYFAPIQEPLVIAQKKAYASGERPRLLVTLPAIGRDVLVLVATDHLISTRAFHVTGQTIALNVDEPKDAAQFTVTAELPNENGVSTASATIAVVPAPKSVHLTIAPNARRYAPGDRARFAIRAVDARGKPVEADVGIGVVDEAIYAVQEASSATPLDAFYGQLGNVYPNYSWFRPNGVVAKMAAMSARAEFAPAPGFTPGVQIRTNFQDTAFWSPSVVTSADGKATISFTWPDNLTTWRATGVGVTRNTDVGQATGSALVTKDFLVRLEAPRFLRTGDTSTIVGIAQGRAAHPHVQLSLEAGALFNGATPAAQSLTLDAFQTASASWPVVAPGVGNAALTLSGTDGALTDAMRLSLPLEAGTAAEHDRGAGTAADALHVSIPSGYVGGDVHLTLAPSIVAQLVQNVRLLDVYPYYCTEQTISAALPAIFVGDILKRAHLGQPDDISTDRIVRNAIARLTQLQHNDGSWGWWEYDSAHPFMTAYAVYALAEFRKAGYVVSSQLFDNGVGSLVTQLAAANNDTLRFWGGAQPNSEWNTRAFMLYALAEAAQMQFHARGATGASGPSGGLPAALLVQTRAHAAQLNPYALAVLGLAEHLLHDDASARVLLTQLDARAFDDGTYAYWRGDTWDYAWENDPVETTAYALRLEVALNPQSPRIPRIVNFLRAQSRGNWWYTTKDTAAAIYALSEALAPDASEFQPNENVNITVDGRSVRTLHITTPVLNASDASVIVPASEVHDGSTIAFERTGASAGAAPVGALYWSSDAIRYVPPSAASASSGPAAWLTRLFARAPDFELTRTYDAGHPGPWRVGDAIQVDVTVRSRSDVQYVAVEDPFPAGVEHQPEQGHADADAWNGLQLFDDRAVFFADRISAGEPLQLRYTLRVTTPGTYTAPAPTAYAMYGPPISAVGRAATVLVSAGSGL